MSTNSSLVVKPKIGAGKYHSITPESANWEYLSFEAREMVLNESWEWDTKENELVIVLLEWKFQSGK